MRVATVQMLHGVMHFIKMFIHTGHSVFRDKSYWFSNS